MNNTRKRRYDTMSEYSTAGTSRSDRVYHEVPNESYDNYNSEEPRRSTQKCSISISGYPPYVTQDVILNYFSKFGKIVSVHFGHKVAHLEYSEPWDEKAVMQRQHYLKGKCVTVRYQKGTFKNRVSYDKPQDKTSDTTVEQLQEATDYVLKLKNAAKIDDQLQMLIQHLQPHVQEQPPKYTKMCADLHEILSSTYPQCKVLPFGSTITGLNFRNSDIDIYISGIKEKGKDKIYLNKIKTLLSKSEQFANLEVMARQDIPILKCTHVETSINCNINLRNFLGISNSQLINYYLNIDSKVKNLMVFLKYYGKVHKFTGQGCFLSTYALCMMLIFFLQQEPYDVPSVLSLQDPNISHDGWNGEFQQIPVNAASLSCTSLLKVLEDFFAFYADFEYRINVICPFLGRTIKKEQFENPETLPDCFNPYKAYLKSGPPLKTRATICIQDPFEHCQNITPVASSAALERFVAFCRLGKTLCQGGENSLLYNLLTMTSSYHKTELILKPEFSQFAVPMGPNLRYIEEKIPDNTSNRQEAIQEAWFKSIVEFTVIVLKDFLKFDITELHDTIGELGKNNQVSYQCLGRMNLWESRRLGTKINVNRSQGIIENELAVTKQLCHLYKDISQSSTVIHFEITLKNNLKPPEMVVNLKKISANMNSYKSFANFLLANLKKWFETYEAELNLCKE